MLKPKEIFDLNIDDTIYELNGYNCIESKITVKPYIEHNIIRFESITKDNITIQYGVSLNPFVKRIELHKELPWRFKEMIQYVKPIINIKNDSVCDNQSSDDTNGSIVANI